MTIDVNVDIKVPDDDTRYTLKCRGLKYPTVQESFCKKYGFDEVPEGTTFSTDCKNIDWDKIYDKVSKELFDRKAEDDEAIKKYRSENGL